MVRGSRNCCTSCLPNTGSTRGREFFRLDPEKVVLAISIGEFKEVTPGVAQVEPEEQEALDRGQGPPPTHPT